MPTGTRLRRSRLARTSAPATSSGVASANSAATSARWTRRGAGLRRSSDRPPTAAPDRPAAACRATPARSRRRVPLAARQAGQPARRPSREAHLVDARNVVARRRPRPAARPIAATPSADQRRTGGEHAGFDQDVLEQPAARGAERAANRQLAAATAGARDQQVDGVGAGDEQHARHGGQHEDQRRADLADDARSSGPRAPTSPSRPGTTTARSGTAAVRRPKRSAPPPLRDAGAQTAEHHREERPLACRRRPARRRRRARRRRSSGPAVRCSTPTIV